MTNLIPQLLPRLGSRVPAGLNLGDGMVFPDYNGQSIVNIAASICRLMGLPETGAPPLLPEILDPLGSGIRRVILVLVDGLALHLFLRWLEQGRSPVWERLAYQGVLAPLTSTTPSTTSAALTSIWTGRSAVEHGIVGYEMWLKEYGLVANMITHSPMTFRPGGLTPGSLELSGFDPETYLPFPTLGQHLAAHGVPAFAFQHHSIARSGLSRMFLKDTTLSPFGTATDLWINLRQLLDRQPGAPLFAWTYWSEIDHFSHVYGPDDERVEAEFALFSQALEELFLRRISAAGAQDTLLILTADHGQILTPKDPHYELRNHPNLARRLHILPTGENRLAYLHVRPGHSQAVGEYIERNWPNQFYLLEPGFAVETGLFGPGAPHPALPDRLGDLMMAARGQAYLWWGAKENPLVGRHGGLSPEEMLVPFLAARI